MSSATNKKEFFYIVVLILTFITVIVGATFAIYALIHRQEEGTSAVYTGTFSIIYNKEDGNIIGNGEEDFLKPTKEFPNLETFENVYRNEFGVTSNGTLDGEISVYIEIERNDFPDPESESKPQLMYALYYDDEDYDDEELYNDGNGPIVSGSLKGKEDIKIAENIELASGETKNFVLFIWWNELDDTEQNPGDKGPLIFLGNLRIDAIQKVYDK